VNVLIIGATRGLGASLANAYAASPNNVVFGTTRSSAGPADSRISKDVHWVPNIDLMSSSVGGSLVNQLAALSVEGGVEGFDIVVRQWPLVEVGPGR